MIFPKRLALCALFSITFVAASNAQDRPTCQIPEDEKIMNECALKAYEVYREELEQAYNNLYAQMDEQGKEKLEVAQKMWLSFRDAECDRRQDYGRFDDIKDIRDYPIAPYMHTKCLNEMTEERADQLRDNPLNHTLFP